MEGRFAFASDKRKHAKLLFINENGQGEKDPMLLNDVQDKKKVVLQCLNMKGNKL